MAEIVLKGASRWTLERGKEEKRGENALKGASRWTLE
jgi:hypothetical protein